MRTLWIIILLSAITFGSGKVVHYEISSKILNRPWVLNVYLPERYEVDNAKYQVIYLLHGNGDNEAAWAPIYGVLDSLIGNGLIPPVIAVSPSGKRSWWVNSTERFESAVINELIPFIDSAFSTDSTSSGRTIMGYSMGGYGALRYGLAYPDKFSACALFSPALYDEAPPPESSARTTGAFGVPFNLAFWDSLNYPRELKVYTEKKYQGIFYIGSGDDDWNNPEGFIFNIEYQALMLYERLHKQNGLQAELRIIDGGHSWKVWKPLFTEAAQIVLNKEKRNNKR